MADREYDRGMELATYVLMILKRLKEGNHQGATEFLLRAKEAATNHRVSTMVLTGEEVQRILLEP